MTARKLISWLVLILSLGIAAYVFAVDQEGLRLLRRMDVTHAMALVSLSFVYLLGDGYRHKCIVEKCSECRLVYSAWFRIFIVSRFLNTVVPQLGNLYRGIRLKNVFGVSYTRYAGSFFSIAWITAWVNALIAFAVVVSLAPDLRLGAFSAPWLLLALAIGLCASPFVGYRMLAALPVRGRFLWLKGKLGDALGATLHAARDGRHVAWLLFLGAVLFAVASMVFFICFHSLGLNVGPAELVLFYVLLQTSTYVSVAPGNLGVQEIAFGVLAEEMGIGMAEGILVSVMIRVAGYVCLFGLALPLGGLDVLRHGEAYRS